jgi:hypothetical protein
VGDANGDGLDDVFIGSSKFKKPALFIQQSNGKFIRSIQPALDATALMKKLMQYGPMSIMINILTGYCRWW